MTRSAGRHGFTDASHIFKLKGKRKWKNLNHYGHVGRCKSVLWQEPAVSPATTGTETTTTTGTTTTGTTDEAIVDTIDAINGIATGTTDNTTDNNDQ